MNRLTTSCSAMAAATLVAGAGHAAVVGNFQFNTAADTEGWSTLNNITGLAADGDSLDGTASNNDPQLSYTGPSISKLTTDNWTTFEFRIRETEDGSTPLGSFSGVGIVLQLNADAPINAAGAFVPTSPTPDVDGFFTVQVDISGFTADTITSIRFDPIGGAASNSNSQTSDNTFEIDYITISDDSVVPEPGSLALLGLGGLLIARRRRA